MVNTKRVKRCCLHCAQDTTNVSGICPRCDNKDHESRIKRDWDREAMFDGVPGEDDYSEQSGADSVWSTEREDHRPVVSAHKERYAIW